MLGIGALFGKLFGTDRAAESLINNTSNALDKLIYTAEEKAEDIAKDRSAARNMIIDWMSTTSGQNLSRRLIALTITIMWVVSKISTIILSIIPIWHLNHTKEYNQTLQIVADSSSDITSAMMLVLGFYFAAPYMGDLAKGALEKIGKVK